MSLDAVMSELEALGKEQTRRIWSRHGMTNLFGVAFADLEKIRKRIKKDHALALALWNTQVADARHLATMIVDPDQMDTKTVNQWAKDADYRMLCGMVASVVRKTRFAHNRVERWTTAKKEWTASIGWNLVAGLAMNDDDLDDAFFLEKLETIEERIHDAPNFAKEGMNNALIAIGGRNPELRDIALETADRIGTVEVDHGLTNCKTPLARPYIEKMWARKGKNKGTARAKVRVTKKTSSKKSATAGRKKTRAAAAKTTASKKAATKKTKTVSRKAASQKTTTRKKATAKASASKKSTRRA